MNDTQGSINYFFDENTYTLALDKAWFIITGSMVFCMMIGFAFLEAGTVRKKNSHIVFFKILLHSLIIVLAYWTLGYAISFGDPNNSLIGGTTFYAGDHWSQPADLIGEQTQYANWVFNYGVATVVVAITNGSISERTSLLATSIHTFLMAAFIYPIIVAWTWGKGWLYQKDYIDFSGSGIVHCTGAFAGLAGLFFVGPRYNRFNKFEQVTIAKSEYMEHTRKKSVAEDNLLVSSSIPSFIEENYEGKQLNKRRISQFRQKVLDEEYENFQVSNLSYVLLGGLWLWMGFIFYNAGSTLGILKNSHDLWKEAELAAVNTFLAGSGGGLIALAIRHPIMNGWKNPRKLRDEAPGVCNSFLAGMVACGAGMNKYEPWSGFVAGMIGGIFYILFCKLFEKLEIDDACEAFQLHGGGGMAGVMITAFLHNEKGILFDKPTNKNIFGIQLLGLIVIAGWSFIWSYIIWGCLSRMKLLRVDLKTEIVGYDYIEFADKYKLYSTELKKKKKEKLVHLNEREI